VLNHPAASCLRAFTLDNMFDTKFSGKSRCLDAFVVALSQACEGGENRWYASTLQLQRVSSEMCIACRSAPTLHVRVDDRTPRALWFPRQSQILSNTRISKVRLSSWVPVVRAVVLTWGLPVEVLVKRAATELWTWTEFLVLRGSVSLQSVLSRWCGQKDFDTSCWQSNGTP